MTGAGTYSGAVLRLVFVLLLLSYPRALRAAEFELMDKMVVNGASTLKSSATIIAPGTQSASLWASTSTVTPHLFISTIGRVGLGTAGPQYLLDLTGGDLNVGGSGIYRRAGVAGTNISCGAGQVLTGGVVSGGITTGGTCADNGGVGSDFCDSDSVLVGNICVDKYEASVWSNSGGGTQYGSASDNYPCSDNGQDCASTNKIYARSVSGYTPSAYLTWFQASAACRNVGKRLLTNAEWTEAANGTPDPGSANNDNGTACNTNGTHAMQTGLGTNCRSAAGAENMIGSLGEWVADWGTAGAGASNASGIGVAWDGGATGYNDDQAWNIGGNGYTNYNSLGWVPGMVPAVFRGGSWDLGDAAGVFAFYANLAPSYWNIGIGFRCGRPLKSVILQSGISQLLDDSSPQLGGDLDVNSNKIISASNGNIVVQPDGTGSVYVNGKSTFTSNVLISSNIYITGNSTFTANVYIPQNNLFISGGATGQLLKKNAAGYLEWGDASGVAGDNLGAHVATTTLNMAGNTFVNVSSVVFNKSVTNYGTTTLAGVTNAGYIISSSQTISGQLVVYGTSTFARAISANYIASSSQTLSGQLTVVGTSTLTGALKAGYVASSSQTISGQLTVNSTVTILAPDGNTFASALWVSTSVTTPYLYVSTKGLVGIGTKTPVTYLHVAAARADLQLGTRGFGATDQAQFAFISAKGDTNSLGWNSGEKGWNMLVRGDANTVNAAEQNDMQFTYYEAGAWTPTLYLDHSGNVGIGTTSPGQKLEVNGALKLAPGSAPTAAEGSIYYNSTQHSAYVSTAANSGAWLQVGPPTTCPSGMVLMGTGRAVYCIETSDRATATYANASNACLNAGRYLCNFQEFSMACNNNGWSTSASRWAADPYAGSDGNVVIVGSGGCFYSSPAYVASSYPFRCCQR